MLFVYFIDGENMDKLEYEKKYLANGCKLIAGTDEVGRGPLAGPVVCAAVIMPMDDIIEGVDDSKLLSEKKREILNDLILKKALAVKICAVDNTEIDRINILNAVKKCMKLCVQGLDLKPDILLVDALKLEIETIACESIIKGDLKSYSIGCASIVAKVYRDNVMREWDLLYPQYGFARHKGYATGEHIKKIKEIGPCAIHRKTFIKNFWAEPEKEEQLSF